MSASKKKTITRRRKKPEVRVRKRKAQLYDPHAHIGKRNKDGTINMCRINDYGDVSIIPVHVFKAQGVAYGPGYGTQKSRREIIQYKLDSLFMTKEEALAKSDKLYRAYERNPYDYEVKPVYLRVFRGEIIRAAHASRYGRTNLNGLFATEAEALEDLIPAVQKEVNEERATLKKTEEALNRLQAQLVGAKKRRKSERGEKYSDVRQYVYDEEATRKQPKEKVVDDD